MLDQLRAEALTLIAASRRCTLSTSGPAGLQASVVDCIVCEGCIYLLLPSTADHCFNLEHGLEVVLTTNSWQLRGAGLTLNDMQGRRGTAPQTLQKRATSTGYSLVEVFPVRMQLAATRHRRYGATIDFDIHAVTPASPTADA